MSAGWLHEGRLLCRSRPAVAALVLLLALAALAVAAGLREVGRQRDTLARLAHLQHEALHVQADKLTRAGDAGSAAYYTFHATWDPPAPAAFLALGLRDSAPYALRLRALALQAQLHEGETFNPELALAGSFDYAFVLVYLAPLVLVALLYDLVAGERRAGRLGLLLALPGGSGRRLWLRRAALRAGLVLGCLLLPVLVAAMTQHVPLRVLAGVVLATAAYLLFWTAVALALAARIEGPAASAVTLVGAWVVLTLLLPTLAHAVLARAVPVHQGVDLMLAQRQAVHGAWDEPREATLQRFFQSHPAWRHRYALPAGFHWKWYYAFQQLGDESVAEAFEAYRAGLRARQRWTARLGWLLPAVGVQTALHRQAGTDLQAQLAYQDDIAALHARLRHHYYPYLFEDLRFARADFEAQPRFEAAVRPEDAAPGSLAGLGLGALAAGLLAARAAGRVRVLR